VAYDEDLAHRVREHLALEPAVTERAMFGGLAFLLAGHMTVAVSRNGGLLLRVGADGVEAALRRPHASQAVMGSRPMSGWVRVSAEGVRTRPQVAAWVRRSVSFVATLPPKR
jgi:TfoX/Sxy family transcriptional regulator of competence genes